MVPISWPVTPRPLAATLRLIWTGHQEQTGLGQSVGAWREGDLWLNGPCRPCKLTMVGSSPDPQRSAEPLICKSSIVISCNRHLSTFSEKICLPKISASCQRSPNRTSDKERVGRGLSAEHCREHLHWIAPTSHRDLTYRHNHLNTYKVVLYFPWENAPPMRECSLYGKD